MLLGFWFGVKTGSPFTSQWNGGRPRVKCLSKLEEVLNREISELHKTPWCPPAIPLWLAQIHKSDSVSLLVNPAWKEFRFSLFCFTQQSTIFTTPFYCKNYRAGGQEWAVDRNDLLGGNVLLYCTSPHFSSVYKISDRSLICLFCRSVYKVWDRSLISCFFRRKS